VRREGDVLMGINVNAERLRCRSRLQSVILFNVYHVHVFLMGLSNIAVRSTWECWQQQYRSEVLVTICDRDEQEPHEGMASEGSFELGISEIRLV